MSGGFPAENSKRKGECHGVVCLSFCGLIWRGDGVEPGANFLEAGPSHLLGDLAVAQEYKGRPKFDLKGPSQRLPFAVLDLVLAVARYLLMRSRPLALWLAYGRLTPFAAL